MKYDLDSRLQTAKKVFEEKEALEAQIHEESLKINKYKARVQEFESTMDMERLNRNDRGRRLGKRFFFIGVLIVCIGVLLIVLSHTGCISEDLGLFGIFACVIGTPPVIIGICLYCKYLQGKKARSVKAEQLGKDKDDFLRNEAEPAMEECSKRIAGLNAQINNLMQDYAEVIAFLPQEYQNIEVVEQMTENISRGRAKSAEQALALCNIEKINKSRREKIELREKQMSPNAGVEEKLREIRKVLQKKESLETQIFEENLKIHGHKMHLQKMESQMSVKVFNRKDRGLRLGRRFGIVAGLIFALMIIVGASTKEWSITLGVSLMFGAVPALVSILLLSAYSRGKKEHARAAEKLKVEYDAYLHEKAEPEAMACGERIREMQAQLDEIAENNAEKLGFLPPEFQNVESVNHIIKNIGTNGANDLRDAIRLCEKEKIHRRYPEKLARRNEELAVNYVDPDTISSGGGILGWMILDGIVDAIFGK